MAYRSQLCETCKCKGSRCYAAPNSCCTAYEQEENITVGNYLAILLTDGKYKKVAEFLDKETENLCNFHPKNIEKYWICFEDTCEDCWERFLNSEYKGA